MDKRRQIAFLCHPYHRGGVTSWMLDAAGGYADNGWEVYFISVDPVKPFHSGRDREEMTSLVKKRSKDIRLFYARVNYTFELGTPDFRAAVYRDLLIQHVPAGVPVIVADDESLWRAAASVADKYPMVGVLHGDQDHYYNKAVAYQDQLAVCACVSSRIKRKAVERCTRIDPHRLFVIPCGVDIPEFITSFTPHDEWRLIFIGRVLAEEKRAEDLVKISAALHEKGVAFHLDIIGSSADGGAKFTELFKEQGVDRFVSFHGWRSKSEIHQMLSQADVLLLTSNSEGMPLAMMEALAAGCGFTGTRVSGVEDYEHHPLSADCLSVYTIGDIPDAINKIEMIKAVPPQLRRPAARKLAEAEFSLQGCLDRYSAAIASVPVSAVRAQPLSLSPFAGLRSRVIATARMVKLLLR